MKEINKLLCSLILLVLLYPVWTEAGLVTKQDTLRPTGDGAGIHWEPSTLLADRWAMIDEVTLDVGDYVKTSTVNHVYSFKTMATCPDDWIWFPPDSVELVLVTYASAGDAGNNIIAFGRSRDLEGTFAWCGDPDTVDIGAAVYDTLKVMYNTTDPCPDANWTAYYLNLDDYQWGVRCIELKTGGLPFEKQMRVAQAYVVGYWTFSDSAEILTSSAVLCSTWGVGDCDNLVECLGSQCYDGIISSTKDIIHAWTIQEYSNPANTQMDSVKIRFTGLATDDNQDSITVFYVTESEGTCTRYGVDTIPDFYYYGTYGGAEHSVVYATCPATGVAWTVSDLTDSNKGFGVSTLHNSNIAFTWFIAIVYYSEEEAVAGNPYRNRILRLGARR